MFLESAVVLSAALALAGCHETGSKGHDHGHGDADAAAASLRLNDGKKWQTDEPLRAGMTAIRDDVQAAVKPIHANTYSPDEYKGLGTRIEAELGKIVANCKLPKDVDDQLHLVLAQISAGADTMKKDGDRMKGAVQVLNGLDSYEKFFDHPGWKPIEH